jgi:hypothetical protein
VTIHRHQCAAHCESRSEREATAAPPDPELKFPGHVRCSSKRFENPLADIAALPILMAALM